MTDNFDMKKFLVENKLGAYARLKETEKEEEAFGGINEMDTEEVVEEDNMEEGQRGWDFLVYDMDPVLAGKLIGAAKKLGVSIKVNEYSPAEWEVRILSPDNDKAFKIVFKILEKMGLDFEESHGMFSKGMKEGNMEEAKPLKPLPKSKWGKPSADTWFSDVKYFKDTHKSEKLKPTDVIGIGDEEMTYADALKKYAGNMREGNIEEANKDLTYNFSHTVSDEAYRRMDGLVSQPEYFNFISSAAKIMDDLTNEGFETKDVYYYLFTRLTADV